MPTGNERLRDEALRRAALYARAEPSIWRRVAPVLRDARKDIERVIRESPALPTARSRRLANLLSAIDSRLAAGAAAFEAELAGAGGDLAQKEAAAGVRALRAALGQAEWTAPSATSIAAAAIESPLDGLMLSEWADEWAASTRRAITRQIRLGVVAGESIADIAARIAGREENGYRDAVMAMAETKARTIARTFVAHVTQAAREQVAIANAEMLEGEQWLSTLDHRTCPICGALDGELFDVAKGDKPPAHPNCRCVRVPVVKGVDKLIRDGVLPEGTRASATGPVPARTTFGAWLKEQPTDVQNDVLGITRAEMFRAGADIDDFVGDDGIIPLDDLDGAL